MTRPGWIVGLAVTVAVLVPYATDAEFGSKVATSVLNLVIGLSIASVGSGLGHSSARVLDQPDPDLPHGQSPYGRPY